MEYATLNNGLQMPKIGFGTWDVHSPATIEQAIDCGYRLIDTAIMYGNEHIIGKAIQNTTIDRKDLFITTKMNATCTSYDKTIQGVINSLKTMQLDYIDLILIHEPYQQYKEMYNALETLYEEGTIKAIGISNLNKRLYDELLKTCKITPMVNQIESHPYFPQQGYANYLLQHHTIPEAWAPFTEGRRKIFNEPILIDIGNKHHKTPAQIILRYLMQLNYIVIPKSSRKERMLENINIFDFELTQEEMHTIQTLDEHHSLFGWYEE